MLAAMDGEARFTDVRESVRLIERLTGRRPTTFAYPFGGEGTYSSVTVRDLSGLGIGIACTTEGVAVSPGSDPLRLPRLVVGDWDPAELEKQIEEVLRA